MSYSDDPSGQTISLPTDDEVADAYCAEHPKCAECGDRGCPFRNDGTWAPEHFGCPGEGLIRVGEEYVHESCKPHYLTIAIRDTIKAGLEVRHGADLSALIIADRSNNVAIQVYELLRQLGVVEHKKG